jgi:hypothetical protein
LVKQYLVIRTKCAVCWKFLGKAASIVRNIGTFLSYLPGKLGRITKTINNVPGRAESKTEMLPKGLKEKVEQYIDRCSISKNFGYIVDQIARNVGGGRNHQSLCCHVNQVSAQLLHDFTSNRNI